MHTLLLLLAALVGDEAQYRPLLSTYLGGRGGDAIRDVVVDDEGFVYVTGGTDSPDYPTTDGAYDRSPNGWKDVFVTKLTPEGEVVWSTLLGGEGYDRAYAIEVRGDGAVVVGGRAGSGFPTTEGTLQPAFGGDERPSKAYGKQDGFVACLSADGSKLLWATYIGVDDGSNLRDLDVGADGAVYVITGSTDDHPNPLWTDGAFQTKLGGGRDALVLKLAPDGSRVAWGTLIGGAGNDGGACSIRAHDDGSVYVLGHAFTNDLPVTEGALQPELAGKKDLFLARVAADGSRLLFLTYLGGEANDNTETHGLEVPSDGTAYVAATTLSRRFPTTGVKPKVPGPQMRFGGAGSTKETGQRTNYPGDGFVARISADGRELLGFSFIGGSSGEGIEGVAIDSDGNVWVSGATYSNDLPTTENALSPRNRGEADGFVACFSPDLDELRWSSYLGGPGIEFARTLAARPSGGVVVAGTVYGEGLPTTRDAPSSRLRGRSDGMLVVLEPAAR